MKFHIAVVSFFLTEVPVLSQAFLRSASTQYRHTLSPGIDSAVCRRLALRDVTVSIGRLQTTIMYRLGGSRETNI